MMALEYARLFEAVAAYGRPSAPSQAAEMEIELFDAAKALCDAVGNPDEEKHWRISVEVSAFAVTELQAAATGWRYIRELTEPLVVVRPAAAFDPSARLQLVDDDWQEVPDCPVDDPDCEGAWQLDPATASHQACEPPEEYDHSRAKEDRRNESLDEGLGDQQRDLAEERANGQLKEEV